MGGGTDVNLEQLRAGMAWWYREYAEEQNVQEREAYARKGERAKAVCAASDPDASVHTGRDLGTLEHEREGGRERKADGASRQGVHLILPHRGRGWPECLRSGAPSAPSHLHDPRSSARVRTI
jgi:hypothetical protein